MWIFSVYVFEKFVNTRFRNLFKLKSRPSQIACTVTTVYVTRTQTVFCVHEYSCMVLISLCNLPIYLSFSVLCLWPPSFVHRVVMLAPSLRCRFCTPVINQGSLSQYKGWFSFILLCWREKYQWIGPLSLHVNYTNMSWEQNNAKTDQVTSIIICWLNKSLPHGYVFNSQTNESFSWNNICYIIHTAKLSLVRKKQTFQSK